MSAPHEVFISINDEADLVGLERDAHVAERIALRWPQHDRPTVHRYVLAETTDRAERLSASSTGDNSDDSHHGGRARGLAGGSEDHRHEQRGTDERDVGDGGAGREVRLLHPLEPGAAHHGAADADGGSAGGEGAGGSRGNAGSAAGLTDRTLAPVSDAAPAASGDTQSIVDELRELIEDADAPFVGSLRMGDVVHRTYARVVEIVRGADR